MSRRFDVFVSHSSKDKPWVHRLVADLAPYGVSVWLDENEIRPGDLFARALEQGIAQSRAVAIVVSPEAMASGWVEQEYYRALSLAQRREDPLQLIPVLLHAVELPGFLADRRWVDFRDPTGYAAHVAELVWGVTGEYPAHVIALDPDALPPLPRDRIPEPAPLPPGSRMHMRRNPQFVGREAQLHELAEALQMHGTAAIGQVAAATGLGGIGKTQLAAEFAHRYGQFFSGGVFWLGCADPASVRVEVAQCGGPEHLGLWSIEGAPNIDTQVARVQRVFAEPVSRLLVLDNCEDEALLAEWKPVTGGCRVLVTSRRATFSPHLGVRTLPLDVLSRAESLALLRSLHRGQPFDAADTATLDRICAELGDLPLALHLAGSFLARYRNTVTPAAYLAQLRDGALFEHPSLQGRGLADSPTKHDLHVGRTFALSWDRLDPANAVDAMARDLLQRAACLAPGESIPHALLVVTLGLPEDDLDAALTKADALCRLLDLGLLDAPNSETYRIHRLVRTFAQQTEGDHADARADVEHALLHEAERVNDSGYPARFLSWQPHLREVADTAKERKDESAASLCHTLSYHLHDLGDYRGARSYIEHSLVIREELLGTGHPLTVASLNNLALLLTEQGAYVEAWPLCERALSIREKQLGPEHPDTAFSLNNLALLLHSQGALVEARPLFERALAIREEQLGPSHPSTATSLNNLAMLLRDQGAYDEARFLLERALAISERQFETEHPNTAGSLHNLASLLTDQGAYDQARPLYERALAISEKHLGPNHPRTATFLNSLAALLYLQGAYDKARPLYERALASWESQFGPNHPHIATGLNSLAALLHAQGAHAEARVRYERALTIRENQLGPDHQRTAESLNNLALLLKEQGAYAEARPLFERALAISERQIGPDHPDTATSLNNLALLLKDQGAYDEARPLYERALAICEARLGPSHPDTRVVRNNLRRLPEF